MWLEEEEVECRVDEDTDEIEKGWTGLTKY